MSPSNIPFQPHARHPYAHAQCTGEDCSECKAEKRRRIIRLRVPNDEPNYLTLPGGIKPGKKFKLDLETKRIFGIEDI